LALTSRHDAARLGSKKVSQNGLLPLISLIGPRADTAGGDGALHGHVEQHEADAGVLGLGVGAHQAEDPVGLVGVAGPDLLAVDDEVVAVVSARVASDARSEPAPGSL
jgi:hypothetical protein